VRRGISTVAGNSQEKGINFALRELAQFVLQRFVWLAKVQILRESPFSPGQCLGRGVAGWLCLSPTGSESSPAELRQRPYGGKRLKTK
jgi:hypothetical protein